MENIFAVLKLFLSVTVFYAILSEQFSGLKIKITRTIASQFGRNKQLINFKLMSKLHEACLNLVVVENDSTTRLNRSRVISKSLKLRT